jgi:hypothetical protein
VGVRQKNQVQRMALLLCHSVVLESAVGANPRFSNEGRPTGKQSKLISGSSFRA